MKAETRERIETGILWAVVALFALMCVSTIRTRKVQKQAAELHIQVLLIELYPEGGGK